VDILAGVLAGIGGMAGVWVVLRFTAPYIAKVAGRIFAVREEMDSDRDRIVKNLREEVLDWQRRLALERADRETAEAELAEVRASADRQISDLTKRLADCETFITRYIGPRGNDVTP
jgi:hypothetical protein